MRVARARLEPSRSAGKSRLVVVSARLTELDPSGSGDPSRGLTISRRLAKLIAGPSVLLGMTRSIGAVLLGLLVACGGRTDRLEGLAGPTEGPTCDANPYGVCYPADHVGTAVGDRIANFRFRGFRSPGTYTVDEMTTPQELALADYYDPDGELGVKILHVMVNTRWCGPSNEEADFVSGANYTGQNTGGASFARELEPLGVRFLEVLVDGIVGQPATLDDLRAWIVDHDIDYTAAVDPHYGELGPLFTTAAIPFNMVIDARSMQILATSVGFDTQLDASVKSWVTWVDTHPPM